MDNGVSSYRRFLKGDEEGFVEIVRDYKDGLILYLDSFVRNLSVAEELAEDTFVKVGIKKPHFSERSSFRTWLYAIGRNIAVDYIRKHSKENTVSIDDCLELTNDELLETSYFREERKLIIHKAMNSLKYEYRQVLWLFYFEDLPNMEISRIMKKSVHAVETLTYRARRALKSELIKEGFDFENL